MLTVDASVWIAAAEKSDAFCRQSRNFLRIAAQRRLRLYVPVLARVEIACALARRRRDPAAGLHLSRTLLNSPEIVQVAIDDRLLAQALAEGTRHQLRAADALYAAVAELYAASLITWDDELVRRAGGVTPMTWLADNA